MKSPLRLVRAGLDDDEPCELSGYYMGRGAQLSLKTSDFVLGLMLFSFAVTVHESSFFLKDRSLLSVFVKVQHIPKICGICIE